MDFIVAKGDGRVVVIDIKLMRGGRDNDARHLHWRYQKIGAVFVVMVVVGIGPHAYRRRTDGVAVVPAALSEP